MTLTAAQARALEWLPSTGEWRTIHRDISAAINSLRDRWWESGRMEIKVRMSDGIWREARLRPSGIAFKAEWETGR